MTADPVSWLVIEPGWEVVGSDGEQIGKVHEVVGDTGSDIFNGLSISTGLFSRASYVPAERVASITEGRVELGLTSEEAKSLGEFEEPPPSEQILPPDRKR